jgi:hypothetical protein
MRNIGLCFVVFVGLVLSACTKPNPLACCVTDEQCAVIGAEELRPCGVGQACNPPTATCVAKQCDTSADCTSPDAPVCSLGLCISGCQVDGDCADVAGKPFCAADNICVGCETNTQCPVEASQCDVETRSCRGCRIESECASGVCIEADGLCADDASVVHVSSIGSDTGTCTAAVPCASLGYALQQVSGTRSVIHLVGDTTTDVSTITLTKPVVLDGTGTRFPKPSSGPTFAIPAGVSFEVTMEGVVFPASGSATVVTVGTSKTLRLFDVVIQNSTIQTTGGTIDSRGSTLTSTTLDCTTGTLAASENRLDNTLIRSSNCQSTVSRNLFANCTATAINVDGGLLSITNNVFTLSDQFVDLIITGGHAPGSVVAFNTIVNSSTVTGAPIAISCDATVRVTSNILAYNSTNPISNNTGCIAHFSLFDVPGAPDATSGNASADVTSFFTNLTAADFHLSTASPARDTAEPGLVPVDFDGIKRGTPPDIGAFEAP